MRRKGGEGGEGGGEEGRSARPEEVDIRVSSMYSVCTHKCD